MLARTASILFATGISLQAANTPIAPEPWPGTRYERLRLESPFDVATAVEKSDEPAPIPWTQGLFISTATKFMSEGAEVDRITVRNTNDPGVFTVIETNKSNELGIEIVKLEIAELGRNTTATVKKGTEFATLKFDATAFTTPTMPQSEPGGRGGPQPVPMPGTRGIQQPTAISRPTNIPRPANTAPMLPQGAQPGAIPRPGGTPQGATAPGVVQPNASQPGVDTRRRVRVINAQ